MSLSDELSWTPGKRQNVMLSQVNSSSTGNFPVSTGNLPY